ncbi:MAG: prepilin-type N-terminal cleavage/methylation domain-containing protein [Planctomycetes bacterium]|jgi:prepilin-type N-terminal cleavage/methylation domain-containing protein|nr:prepilin-type N-terminal cleavage/methylation domain-containing protein [Phycisphaerae bacterium]NBB95016.1 prepilin-type N-terminal cleavage/methylation domain-containing protein [Planctomycetota bacterium]
MNGCSPSRQRRAFTLVEIIIVVIILGIVSGIVIISTMPTETTSAVAAADIIARDLELARQEANGRQEALVVEFSVSSNSYSIKDTDGNVISHPVKQTTASININDEVTTGTITLVSADFGDSGQSIYFSALGEPVASDLTTPISSDSKVVVQCGDETYSVIVAPVTGRVRVQAGG